MGQRSPAWRTELERFVAALNRAGFVAPPEQLSPLVRTVVVLGACVRALTPKGDLELTWSELAGRAALQFPEVPVEPLLQHVAALPANAFLHLTRPEYGAGDPGQLYEALLGLQLGFDARGWRFEASPARRRAGSHFTPRALADAVVARCLAPLSLGRDSDALLDLRLCDPALGGGVFLCAAASWLYQRRRSALQLEERPLGSSQEAFAEVVRHCLSGMDNDPVALLLTQFALWRESGSDPTSPPNPTLRLGDAVAARTLLDDPAGARPTSPSAPVLPMFGGSPPSFPALFPNAFDRANPGFDAVLGNPPWVAYVGRAAQPLSDEQRRDFKRRFRSFHRYRSLHGIFVEQSARLLREGGRLGLILPTSVADLQGYEPARQAHDALCVPDAELLDLGDGRFPDVFQPSMALLSTRSRLAAVSATPWPLERRDRSELVTGLLERLASGARCPPELFGERGYQTTGPDRQTLVKAHEAPSPNWLPLLSGTEVQEFRRGAPRWYADPSRLSQALRPPSEWGRVRLLIRQTARFPIAALACGTAFRNSILAGFESETIPAALLLAFLNSTLIRWFHFHAHRDARQGMPQLKIAHLRALPCPPARGTPAGDALLDLGQRLGEQNSGLCPEERNTLDRLTNDAFHLTPAEGDEVARWGQNHPPPKPRHPHD